MRLAATRLPGKSPGGRIWEIDALRGAAVIAMAAFHAIFDLSYFAGIDLLPGGAWFWIPRAIGAAFIFLAGISLTLGRRNPLRRGATIFAWGLAITAVTWLAFPTNTIWFGVLHLIGLSLILAPLLERWALPLAAGCIALGAWLQGVTVPFPWLLWLGLRPEAFYTFDYYPLLPWLGVMLLGVYAGKRLYAGGRKFKIPELGTVPGISQLCLLGRNSLLIYLLHQPVLVLLVKLVTSS